MDDQGLPCPDCKRPIEVGMTAVAHDYGGVQYIVCLYCFAEIMIGKSIYSETSGAAFDDRLSRLAAAPGPDGEKNDG